MSDRRAEWLLGVTLFVALGLPAVALDKLALLALFHDDAFYYLQVARNVAGGAGFTFDGIHATNGFHPLWLFILVGIQAVLDEPWSVVRAVGLVQAGLVAGCGVLLFRTLASRLGRGPAAVAALVLGALPGSRQILWCGMESSLLLLLLVVVWRRWLALPAAAGPRDWVGLGIACALAASARLEALLALPVIVALGCPRLRARRTSLVALSVPLAVAGAFYLAWNRIAFGTWLPISGMVKAHVARAVEGSWWEPWVRLPWIGREVVCRLAGAGDLQQCPAPVVALYLAGEAVLLALCLLGWRSIATRVREAGLAFPVLTAALLTLADVWAVRYLAPWYRGPILLCTALAAALVAHELPRVRVALLALLFALAAGRSVLHVAAPREPASTYAYHRVRAAEWLGRNAQAADRIGSWNAGMLGYFSGRHVVNLDGLVNDVGYFRRVIQGKDLAGYLESERVVFLADQACGPAPRPTPYLGRTGSEHLDARLDLVAAFHAEDDADGCPGYAVWRVRTGAGSRVRARR
jgi:hypothetical protein